MAERARPGLKAARKIGAALLFVAAFAGSAAAQDWQAEWAKTVAQGEAEGAVVIQSQPNQAFRDFVLREFPKAYPKIALQLSVIPEEEFIARIRTERQADKYLWDIAVSGASTGYTLDKEGIVDPLAPELILPEVNNAQIWGGWDESYVDTPKKYVFAMSKYIAGPWYDALRIPPEKVAQLGLRTLLDPAYEGKIAWNDPAVVGSGRSYGLLLRAKLGDDALKKIVVDQKPQLVAQQFQVVEAMARGTAWIGIGPPVRSLIAPYAQAGIKTDIRSFGTSPDVNLEGIGGSAIYVFNRAPHPNARRVFLNWLLGKDVQYALAKALDQDSRREDIPSTAEPDSVPIKGAKYIAPQREEMLGPLADSVKFIASVRKAAGL